MQSNQSVQGSVNTPAAISVVEEQAEVITRTEQSGAVRVRIESDEAEQAVALAHTRHEFETHRVPRGVTVTQTRAPWTEGEVLVVPVYEEVEVIERRLVLKEEIRLTPRVHCTTTQVDVPLRKERVVIERQQADGSWHQVDCGPSAAGQARPIDT